MNKDLAVVSAVWRALFGVRGRRFYGCRPLFVYLSKSHQRWFCGGWCVRLWRRTQFSMLHCRGIIAKGAPACLW